MPGKTAESPDDEPRVDAADRSRLPPPPTGRFADDLIGLDPHDAEAQAFAAHLDRMQRDYSGYTVEGYIRDMGEFADAANRQGGHQLLKARLIAAIILVPFVIAALSGVLAVLALLGIIAF